MPAIYLLLFTLTFVASSQFANARDIAKYDGDRLVELKFVGVPTFDDGDTIWIEHHQIRLAGIDALEKGQTCEVGGAHVECAKIAMMEIRKVLEQQEIECVARVKEGSISGPVLDPYGRYIARCFRGGADLNLKLVRDGWVFPYGGRFKRKLSIEAYSSAGATAMRKKIGVHGMNALDPYDFRRLDRKAKANKQTDIGDLMRRAEPSLRAQICNKFCSD